MIMSQSENLTDFCKMMETGLDPCLASDLIHVYMYAYIVVTSDDDIDDDASIHCTCTQGYFPYATNEIHMLS